MDNAVNAVNKLFSGGTTAEPSKDATNTKNTQESRNAGAPTTTTEQKGDTTVDTKTEPGVEHTHVKKEHETREQTHIEREKHQDHYKTTIQPLTDSEVQPEKHDHTEEVKLRGLNRDDGAAKAQAEKDRAGFESTKDVEKSEVKAKEPTQVDEHVHHHLHETVVPVIEKEVIDPSVTHKKINVKENIQEPSQNHGVTTKAPLSVQDFESKAGGKN